MDNAKILIIEDSAAKRAVYKEMLEREGYNIIEAASAEEGMNKARNESPDVIIMSLEMPNIDGFKMVEKLKKDDLAGYTPVICVSTTCKDMENKIKALTEAGAEECFYMPENMAELLLKVQVMIRIRKIYLELLEKNKQLQTFNKAAVDRELKMVELKGKIKKLEDELTKYKK